MAEFTFPVIFDDHWGYLHIILNEEGLRKFFLRMDELASAGDILSGEYYGDFPNREETKKLWDKAHETLGMENIKNFFMAWSDIDACTEENVSLIRDITVYE